MRGYGCIKGSAVPFLVLRWSPPRWTRLAVTHILHPSAVHSVPRASRSHHPASTRLCSAVDHEVSQGSRTQAAGWEALLWLPQLAGVPRHSHSPGCPASQRGRRKAVPVLYSALLCKHLAWAETPSVPKLSESITILPQR